MDTAPHVEVGPVYNACIVNELLHSGYRFEQLASFGRPPASLPGFVTFFDPGWSILRLRECARLRVFGSSQTIFYPQTWYDNEPFAKLQEPPGYRQLQMRAAQDSFGKIFAKQKALVPPDAEIPTARAILMGVVIHFLATGERLVSDHWVRCADQTLCGGLVIVGDFGPHGIDVDTTGHGRSGDLGVVLSRKF